MTPKNIFLTIILLGVLAIIIIASVDIVKANSLNVAHDKGLSSKLVGDLTVVNPLDARLQLNLGGKLGHLDQGLNIKSNNLHLDLGKLLDV